jgi:hypothetical protein
MVMKKSEILKSYTLTKLDPKTVSIKSRDFDFFYIDARDIVRDEYKDSYKYFGGLQCNYNTESPEYKELERWLVELAEQVLGIKN